MAKRESDSSVLAHGSNRSGQIHHLRDHLQEVAEMCKQSTTKISLPLCGYMLGYWHDIGKLHPEWQTYLRASIGADSSDAGAVRGPAHSPTGALRASKIWPLAMVIAAHHGHLHSSTDFRERLRNYAEQDSVLETDRMWKDQEPESVTSILTGAQQEISSIADNERTLEFVIRFLLSALVDADRLDTEAHYNPEKATARGDRPALKRMNQKLAAELARMTERAEETKVNRVRSDVLSACTNAAVETQGIFRLTAPTGAGKTLSSLAFALNHAVRHHLERIIIAIPYTSIIDQTADVYRRVLGTDCVLEHHSAVSELNDDAGELGIRLRLATENWDHPLIVTTTNQLFESLLSSHASRCRKIHNMAHSVIIIDEVQTLPVELLQTTIEAIRFLTSKCGTTVVLCTATQPTISGNKHLEGLQNIRDILPDAARIFEALRRVKYEWPKEKQSWNELAKVMIEQKQVLAVVNTKSDALKLLDALDDPESLHLSTSLCGSHRRWVIESIKSRLKNGEPCRVVSTQVVEAGVDLDFPVVMRAVGPLDRIVQVAGRCNREGRLEHGRIVVFDPADGKTPPGAYTTGTHEAESLINAGELDPDNPDTFERYFSRLYGSVDTDRFRIEERRKHLDYPEVAKRYQFIRDSTVPIVVTGWRSDEIRPLLAGIKKALDHGGILGREEFRRLQPYIVNIREKEYQDFSDRIDESIPGVSVWTGPYDPIRGLVTEYTRTEDNLW